MIPVSQGLSCSHWKHPYPLERMEHNTTVLIEMAVSLLFVFESFQTIVLSLQGFFVQALFFLYYVLSESPHSQILKKNLAHMQALQFLIRNNSQLLFLKELLQDRQYATFHLCCASHIFYPQHLYLPFLRVSYMSRFP